MMDACEKRARWVFAGRVAATCVLCVPLTGGPDSHGATCGRAGPSRRRRRGMWAQSMAGYVSPMDHKRKYRTEDHRGLATEPARAAAATTRTGVAKRKAVPELAQ